MGWTFKEEYLDLVLVPSGILIMSIYHVFLIIRYKRDLKQFELKSSGSKNSNSRNSNSEKSNWINTSIGYENRNKKAWAANILEMEVKDRGFAVTVLNGQISAATTLTSISLTLCALIGVLLGKSMENLLTSSFIFGNKSILHMLAFLFAPPLTRLPRIMLSASKRKSSKEVLECIQTAVLRGSNFWAVGLRALYFATNLLLWVFGPIPMFVGSLVTVIISYNLDMNTKKPIDYGKSINDQLDSKR